jgi:hypothetical protein
VTGPLVSAAAGAAQKAASAEQSADARVLLCFIVFPPFALRPSNLTNLILIAAVELYLKRLLPAILATAFLSVPKILMLFCANASPWPQFGGERQILMQLRHLLSGQERPHETIAGRSATDCP